MCDPRKIRVFIASPGDLNVERVAFKKVIDALNGDFAEGKNVTFVAKGWEDTICQVGRRPQSEINKEVEKCDVFILAMFKRWGQKAPDVTHPATSYTEEEFNVALTRLQITPKEPIIHVLFKNIDAEDLIDPGPQLTKVLKFKVKLEQSRRALPIRFDNETDFRRELNRLLKAAAHQLTDGDGEPLTPNMPDPVVIPVRLLKAAQDKITVIEKRLKKLEAELQQQNRPMGRQAAAAESQRAKKTLRTQTKIAFAKREQAALRLAEKAAKAALDGRVEEARQDFAKSTDGTANLQVLELAYEFYFRTGELGTAAEMLDRWLAITGRDAATTKTAAALGNLGMIYRIRGEKDKALRMLQTVLGIHEKSLREIKKLVDQNCAAPDDGKRKEIDESRRETDQAEEMLQKALIINLKLRRQASTADDDTNLGQFYWPRDELDRVEKMIRLGLRIDKKLDRREGIAIRYDSLGLIHQTRNEPEKAKEMHEKALKIEKLSNQKGIARHCGNLGLVYESLVDLKQAQQMHEKSLKIEKTLKDKEGMARQYGNLGLIYRKRGDLKQAKEMHEEALKIEEKLANQEEMAIQYCNLALIHEARSDWKQAEEMHQKALAIFEKLGHQEYMAAEYRNLVVIYRNLDKLDLAKEMRSKGLAIDEKLSL